MKELIYKQDALNALDGHFTVNSKEDADRIMEYLKGVNARMKALPTIKPKNGTLIIPLNESDFKSVKRIMLDNKPWCRMFYEDASGEAHWIKKYTPDDGEIYECDNCGVTWQFNDGGPEENEAFFCPKCGFKMERGDEE